MVLVCKAYNVGNFWGPTPVGKIRGVREHGYKNKPSRIRKLTHLDGVDGRLVGLGLGWRPSLHFAYIIICVSGGVCSESFLIICLCSLLLLVVAGTVCINIIIWFIYFGSFTLFELSLSTVILEPFFLYFLN